MQFIQTTKQESNPFTQLLLLGIYAIAGLLVTVGLGFVVAFFCYGKVIFEDTTWLNGTDPKHIGALKIVLVAQQIGLFLFPALALSLTERRNLQGFYDLKKPKFNSMLILLLLMICAMPIMGLINETNQQMVFPGFLRSVEDWMRKMEDEGAKITVALLKMKSIGDYLIALFVIAVVPAICEEFIFRGALQRTFLRGLKNPHTAIWLSAFAFSAIHFQFYGFFPRLFLGAAFGYIYFWTGSLWYTVFAHFLNNAFAISIAWYFQKNNSPLKANEEIPVQWYGYVISAILTLALFKLLKDKTTKHKL